MKNAKYKIVLDYDTILIMKKLFAYIHKKYRKDIQQISIVVIFGWLL